MFVFISKEKVSLPINFYLLYATSLSMQRKRSIEKKNAHDLGKSRVCSRLVFSSLSNVGLDYIISEVSF